MVMVINTTFNNISVISWRSTLLLQETWVLREKHRPVARHWQTLSHNGDTSSFYVDICRVKISSILGNMTQMNGTESILEYREHIILPRIRIVSICYIYLYSSWSRTCSTAKDASPMYQALPILSVHMSSSCLLMELVLLNLLISIYVDHCLSF
jgi:hypothetical protein